MNLNFPVAEERQQVGVQFRGGRNRAQRPRLQGRNFNGARNLQRLPRILFALRHGLRRKTLGLRTLPHFLKARERDVVTRG